VWLVGEQKENRAEPEESKDLSGKFKEDAENTEEIVIKENFNIKTELISS